LVKGVVFREIIAIRDGKNHNAMKGRSLADFVTGRICVNRAAATRLAAERSQRPSSSRQPGAAFFYRFCPGPVKGVVFREIIAIRDGKNHNAMKGRSLADFVGRFGVVMSFDSLGLNPDILRAVAEQGYVEPTPIQQRAGYRDSGQGNQKT
jgi:hypothetical protein